MYLHQLPKLPRLLFHGQAKLSVLVNVYQAGSVLRVRDFYISWWTFGKLQKMK